MVNAFAPLHVLLAPHRTTAILAYQLFALLVHTALPLLSTQSLVESVHTAHKDRVARRLVLQVFLVLLHQIQSQRVTASVMLVTGV